MRNMSFALTTKAMRERRKSVTRRLGWADLKPGERVCAVVKGQGIPKGGKVERICVIECVSNAPEALGRIYSRGPRECAREGFPKMSKGQFIDMFCRANKCAVQTVVNRIEFKYVEVSHG